MAQHDYQIADQPGAGFLADLNAALAAADLSPAAGGAPDAAAEPAGDSGDRRTSTDADIAGWIVAAAHRYDDCRARIDALRRWDEVTHGGR